MMRGRRKLNIILLLLTKIIVKRHRTPKVLVKTLTNSCHHDRLKERGGGWRNMHNGTHYHLPVPSSNDAGRLRGCPGGWGQGDTVVWSWTAIGVGP